MSSHRLCCLSTSTPLHIGTDGGSGLIDKPVLRERATGWPILPGSALKGVLASLHGADNPETRKTDYTLRMAFGTSASAHEDSSGSLIFTDARLICLPVRSLRGTVAWVTSRFALLRLRAELVRFGCAGSIPDAPSSLLEDQALIATAADSVLRIPPQAENANERVVLEDFCLECDDGKAGAADEWAAFLARLFWGAQPAQLHVDENGTPLNKPSDDWNELFRKRFAIVDDALFDHLCAYGLEVRARVKLDNNKMVEHGKLWYEELLPEQSLLIAHVFCEKVFRRKKEEEGNGTATRADVQPEELLKQYCNNDHTLQFGGTASVGRGQCRIVFHDGLPESAVPGQDAAGPAS